MHQLQHRGRRPGGGQLFAHEILHRLDVVIDALLDGLDGLGGASFRIACQRGAALEHRRRQRAGQQAQPRSVSCSNHSASTRMRSRISAGFGKIIAQRRRDGGVTPVHGRKGGQS